MSKKLTVLTAVTAAAVTAVLSYLVVAAYMTNRKIEPVETVLLSEAGMDLNDKPFSLIAQGGLSAVSPENTIIAVDKAGREGFTAVRFDIRETLDGVWVLMQDDTINKMTDGRGKIIKHTYFELLDFTVDNGANIEQYPGTKIAELEDVLDLCANYGVRPYIHVEQGSTAGLEKLAAVLAARADTQYFSLLSGDRQLLQAFKKLSPSTELWYVTDRLSKSIIEWIEENEGFGIVFDAAKKSNTDEKIEQAVKSGIETACQNTNDIQTVQRMAALGVKSFYTCCVLPK